MASASGAEVEAAGLINTLQMHVNDIRGLIQCGICIRPLYEPFTLACGHTFCYSCLSSWFSGGRSKRTCPDCRAPVKTQPAPAYLVRAVVQMFTGRAELLDKGETTAEHTKNQREEAEKLDKDKENPHPHNGGLFGGLFRSKAPPEKPLLDVEDGVVRCPRCSWELEGGEECEQCGYVYRPDSEGTDYTGTDDYSGSDLDSMFDGEEHADEELRELEDDAHVWGAYGPLEYFGDPTAAMVWGSVMENPYHTSRYRSDNPLFADYPSEYDEDLDEDYDDADSFIDNDEPGNGEEEDSESDHSTLVDGARARNPISQPVPQTRTVVAPYVDTDPSEDGEGDEDDEFNEGEESHVHVRFAAPEAPRAQSSSSPTYHDTRSSPTSSSGAEETDISHLDFSHQYPQSIVSATTGEADGSRESSSSPPRPMGRPRTTGSSARNAITIDDSDNDQPVGPVRRAMQRRRTRYSPY